MGNIVKATVTIQGTRPILWHWFGPDAIPLEKIEKSGVAGNDPEEWKRSVLYTPEGQLYVEPTYVFGCLRDGAKYIKRSRASVQKLVAATLQVLDNMVLFDRFIPGFDGKLPVKLPTDPTLPVYLDIRSSVNPNTKSRNVRYRVAAGIGWKTAFTVIWDKTVVSTGEMQSIFIQSGQLVGLADGRNIGFGRFDVLKVEVSEY